MKDIKKYQKFSELRSYFIWEVKSKLKIWKEYLVINENYSQINSDNNFIKLSLPENQSGFGSKIKFELKKIETKWDKICIASDNSIIGNTITERDTLVRGDKYGAITEKLYRFEDSIDSIYFNNNKIIFICCSGSIFRSDDEGRNFKKVMVMSNKESKFLFHVGMTEITPRTLLIGEYSNIWDNKSGWKNASYLYISYDEGLNWESTNFLKNSGVNKHIHIIRYLKNFGMLVLTDGDNKKQLWANKINGNFNSKNHFLEFGNWKLLTKKHMELGGYSSVVELNNKALFGTDYLGGTNFLVETEDFEKFNKKAIPDPYRRGYIECLAKTKNIIWASIKPPKFSQTKGLIMYNTLNSDEWFKLFEYDYDKYMVEIISKGQTEENQNCLYFSIIKTNGNIGYNVLRLEQIQ